MEDDLKKIIVNERHSGINVRRPQFLLVNGRQIQVCKFKWKTIIICLWKSKTNSCLFINGRHSSINVRRPQWKTKYESSDGRRS